MTTTKHLIVIVLILFFSSAYSFGQTAEQMPRESQWNAYGVPEGKYVRFLDKQRGYSFWHPADWNESGKNGQHTFTKLSNHISITALTEDIPDGYGIANYTASFIQQLHNEKIDQEKVQVRHVLLAGTDGREVTFSIEASTGQSVRETWWIAAVGPRAYAFFFAGAEDSYTQFEPYFKRSMLSVHLGSSGHWNTEFEDIRAKLPTTTDLPVGREVAAALLEDSIRAGKLVSDSAVPQIVEMSAKSPDVVLDMLTDYNPNVRADAIAALGKINNKELNAPVNDALVWALGDKDNYCAQSAAQAITSRGPDAIAILKTRLPNLIADPNALLQGVSILNDDDARNLAADLLRNSDKDKQIAGLEIATAFPLKGLTLPYSSLLSSKEPSVVAATIEAARLRRDTTASDELVRLLGSDSESLAARALGEIATGSAIPRLQERIKEIDSKFTQIFSPAEKSDEKSTGKKKVEQDKGGIPYPPPPPPPPAPSTSKGSVVQLEGEFIAPPTLVSPGLDNKMQESDKLAKVRGALVLAISKIEFRNNYSNAKTTADKQKILNKALTDSGIKEWVQNYLANNDSTAAASVVNLSRLQNAPTTGETLLPQTTQLYLMSPNFEETILHLDNALSGIQMETVHDQMTMVRLLKTMKSGLSNALNAEATPDAGTTIGVDLKSPLTVAAWTAAENPKAAYRGAVILRVVDRARFERSFSYYESQLGNFDNKKKIFQSALDR